MRFPNRMLPLVLGLLLPALAASAQDNDHDHDETVALYNAFDNDYGVYGLDEGAEDNPATYAFTGSLDPALTRAFHVGYDNPYNLLTVSGDSSTAISTAGLVIGENSDANGVFLGRSATWTVSASDTSSLIVGNYGGGNTLSVTSGANFVTASAVNTTIGAWSEGNRVEISGKDAAGTTASSWDYSGAITVGYFGDGNSLDIKDGAVVTAQATTADTATRIGYASDGNAVTVSGPGTVWNATASSGTTPGGLYVGYGGNDNTLTISDGAVVNSEGGISNGTAYRHVAIGFEADSTGNQVLVTGQGSQWNTMYLCVGYEGSNNRLDITDGGVVINHRVTGLYLGAWAVSTGNEITVSGAGSLLSTGILRIGGGGESGGLGLPGGGSYNTLTITGGGAVEQTNSSGGFHIGSGAESRGNSVIVSGLGSTLTTTGSPSNDLNYLMVGAYGDDNLLRIENGGRVTTNSGGVIGYWQYLVRGTIYETGVSTDNRALVTGQGSQWDLAGTFYVGQGGQDNRLDIEAGGRVTSATGIIGSEQTNEDAPDSGWLYRGADRNTARISGRDEATGHASAWEITGALTVGRGGSDNTLAVEAGGRVTSGASVIGALSSVITSVPGNSTGYQDGHAYGADSNTALVSGKDAADNASAWEVAGTLTVGQGGQGNTLRVEDGGRVTSSGGLIGQYGNITWERRKEFQPTRYYEQEAANDNAVLVTGAGSRWKITGDLGIGYDYNGSFASAYNVNGVNYNDKVEQVFLGNATGNTLTIADGGLVTVGGAFNIVAGNFLQLDGGYFAWEGDHLAALSVFIAEGKAQLYDATSSSWSTVTDASQFSFTYIELTGDTAADTTASSEATHGLYAGLAGYTILTDVLSVPEPASYAALAGLSLLACALARRRRAAHSPPIFPHSRP